MVLEATVILVDNSEWMRNGDFNPSRIHAQADAATLLSRIKREANPENSQGLIAMAGDCPQTLVTLTANPDRISASLRSLKVHGKVHLAKSLLVAQLLLKHRQNKNQRQRIVAFIGSPLTESTKELLDVAVRLRESQINVDIINFGETDVNSEKIGSFIAEIQSRAFEFEGLNESMDFDETRSTLCNVPCCTPHSLTKHMMDSDIVASGMRTEAAGAYSGGDDLDLGVDPMLDPELALALRLSLEEEEARVRNAAKNTPGAQLSNPGQNEQGNEFAGEPMMTDDAVGPAGFVSDYVNNDDDLQTALRMSLEMHEAQQAAQQENSNTENQEDPSKKSQ